MMQRIIIIIMLSLWLTGCDSTMYIALRNYQSAVRVNVAYQDDGKIFMKDSLLTKSFGASSIDSTVAKLYTSSKSYSFIAPANREILIDPVAVNRNPVKQIQIATAANSLLTINLWDKEQLRELEREGRVILKSKGFTKQIILVYK